MRSAIEPDMVLGKDVVDAGGVRLGQVEDVGLVDQRRVKFLVVDQPGQPGRFLRVPASEVEEIGATLVTLRPAR
ncbi:MAG TPA: PRC-barrel domain-containing protein [Candidatus Thermoplasmatota archaeon]|nr:PRC-barrel domain-containing protein [Candidatus Thermoplasmatota archaeon]